MAYSTFERWSGSAWVDESSLIRLTVEDTIYKPQTATISIADPQNTIAANYSPFQKVRIKEGKSKIIIFYGQIINILPENDNQYGQVVVLECADALDELRNRDMLVDYSTTQNTNWLRKGYLIRDILQGYSTTHPAHAYSGTITLNTTKFAASTVAESGNRKWNFKSQGSGKSVLDTIGKLAASDPHSTNRESFGYAFHLDYRTSGNTVYSDFNYFKRGTNPSAGASTAGIRVEYGGTEGDQTKSMHADYSFESSNAQELVTRVNLTYVDENKKPHTIAFVLLNTGAFSGTFSDGEAITWSGSHAATYRMSGGSGGARTVLITDFTETGLAALPGQTITGSSSSASTTVNATSATLPGVLSAKLQREIPVSIEASDFETAQEAFLQAFAYLYQTNDSVERAEFTIAGWPLFIVSGTHNGSNNSANLRDTTKNWSNFDVQTGQTVQNVDDGTFAEVTGTSGTTDITSSPNLDWDNGEAYKVYKSTRVGMNIRVVNSRLSIDKDMLVTGITYDEGGGVVESQIQVMSTTRGHTVRQTPNVKDNNKLNSAGANNSSRVGQTPLGQMQFASDLAFTESDYNTVAWNNQAITWGDGTSYTVNAGNTGNMSANTAYYIYFDFDTSTTVLQVTSTHANIIGPNKTLLCTCFAGATTNDPPQIRVQQGDSNTGTPKTFVQASAPANTVANPLRRGDIWFDSDDNNQMYRWNGTTWASVRDGLATAALNAANAKIQTYVQSSAPYSSGGTVGDLWVDTGNGSMLKRWDGSAWQDAESFLTDYWTNNGRTEVKGGKIETNLIILDKATGSAANTGNIVQNRTTTPSTAGSGDRILLSADGIFGYSGSTLQVSMTQGSGGTLLAGAGEIVMSADGIKSGANISAYSPAQSGNSAIQYSFLLDSQASTGGNFATSATGIFHIVGHNANSGSTVSPLAWFTVRDNDGAYYAKEHMRQFIMLPGQRSSTYLGPSGKFQRSGTHRAAMYVMMGGGANYAGGPGGNDSGGGYNGSHSFRTTHTHAGNQAIGTDIYFKTAHNGNTDKQRIYTDYPIVSSNETISQVKSIGLAPTTIVSGLGTNMREVVLTGGKSPYNTSNRSPWTASDDRNEGNVVYNFPSTPQSANHASFRGKVLGIAGSSGGTGSGGAGTYTETNEDNGSMTDTIIDLEWVTGTGGGDVFKTIAVSGQSDVVADLPNDTLTLVAGTGMTITTNATTDTITFVSSGGAQTGVVNRVAFYDSTTTIDDHPAMTFVTGSSPSSYEVNIVDAVLDVNDNSDSRIIIPVGSNKWAT